LLHPDALIQGKRQPNNALLMSSWAGITLSPSFFVHAINGKPSKESLLMDMMT